MQVTLALVRTIRTHVRTAILCNTTSRVHCINHTSEINASESFIGCHTSYRMDVFIINYLLMTTNYCNIYIIFIYIIYNLDSDALKWYTLVKIYTYYVLPRYIYIRIDIPM